MAFLAQRASGMFVEIARINLGTQEHRRGYCAKTLGKFEDAARHYANYADAARYESLPFLEETRTSWTLFFPLASPVLDAIRESLSTEHAARIDERSRRMLLADVLERAQKPEDARRELATAARLVPEQGSISEMALTREDAAIFEHEKGLFAEECPR